MFLDRLFGGRKRDDGREEVLALRQRAIEATQARDLATAETLCRELCVLDPSSAEPWNLLGINLIRRGVADPAIRCEAVLAWMRAMTLRSADARAADHLQLELQYPEDLIAPLMGRLADPANAGDDAAAVLGQIGPKARAALEGLVRSCAPGAERARRVLATLG